MQVFSTILVVILMCGLVTFIVYQVIGIVKDIKRRKEEKNKENIVSEEDMKKGE